MKKSAFPLLLALTMTAAMSGASAQSVLENLPPPVTQAQSIAPAAVVVKPVPGAFVGGAPSAAVPAAPAAALDSVAPAAGNAATVTDVSVDVTADSAAHARDQAVMQAQRLAYAQLCTRLGVPDYLTKIDDDSLAAMVKSFDTQSERLSAVRYIGVFTVHFKPAALQKRLGKYAVFSTGDAGSEEAKTAAFGTVAHITVAIDTPSLAAFSQARRRLNELPQVSRIDAIGLGRGVSHVDLSYTGTLSELIHALNERGLNIYQGNDGEWILTETGAK